MAHRGRDRRQAARMQRSSGSVTSVLGEGGLVPEAQLPPIFSGCADAPDDWTMGASVEALLASAIHGMWSLVAFSFTAGKLLKKEQMKQAALFLRKVLDVGSELSEQFVCPACGALNNLPSAALPTGLAPILSRLLPTAEGRAAGWIPTACCHVSAKRTSRRIGVWPRSRSLSA